jgi:fructuronate reductase
MDDVTPTLPQVAGHDLEPYKADLLSRFANPSLRHRTWQIAMDGSQKLPQRLLGSARDLLAKGLPLGVIPLGVAGWMRYVMAVDEKGAAIDVRDPMAKILIERAQAGHRDAAAIAASLFALEAIFGADLPGDPRFTTPIVAALDAMLKKGTAAAIA